MYPFFPRIPVLILRFYYDLAYYPGLLINNIKANLTVTKGRLQIYESVTVKTVPRRFTEREESSGPRKGIEVMSSGVSLFEAKMFEPRGLIHKRRRTVTRAILACEACCAKKYKCDETHPCGRCRGRTMVSSQSRQIH